MIRSARGPLGAALLAAALFTACNDASDSRRLLLEQLAQRESFWATNGAASYTIEMTRECNCPDIFQVRLEVMNGVVVSGVHVFSGDTLTAEEIALQYTVPDLFELVRDALERGAATTNVAYNQDYGFVEQLYIDYDPRRTTDDIAITVDDFVPAGGQ
jgi:hypothetical protein